MSRASRSLPAALGLALALGGLCAPPPAATAATTTRTWDEAMAYRVATAQQPRPGVITFAAPGPRAALGERLVGSAQRIGGAPTSVPAGAVDGRVTVQRGTSVRSIDVSTGAVTTESVATGYVRPSWDPAGDRLHLQKDSGDWVYQYLADDDGAHLELRSNEYRLSDHESHLVDARPWSPFGDSLQEGAEGKGAASALSVNGFRWSSWWYATAPSGSRLVSSPVVNTYGDLAVQPWTDTSVTPSVDRLSVQSVRFPDGVQPHGSSPFPLTLTAPRLGRPALGLPPGGDVALGSPDLLAVPAQSAGGASLLVDHADGRGPVAVADLGAVCPGPQVAFAPSHTRLVYLRAVGASGAPCASTELWELVPDGMRYDGGSARRVAASGSVPFTNLTWKAETPPAYAGRIAGRDRVETAVAASSALFADRSAPVVVVVNSTAFPDALAATPLAGRRGGPVLMTSGGSLDPRTKAEVLRSAKVGATVYLVGGEGVLSAGIRSELLNDGFTVKRLGGATRYDTAVAVAKELDATARVETLAYRQVLLADGTNFPDALAAGSAAAQEFGVVVLTNGGSLPPVTRDYVRGLVSAETMQTPMLTAVGGPAAKAAASDVVLGPQTTSLVGGDRYATAAMVLRHFAWPTPTVGVVDGRNWPDAVAGGVAMANIGGGIVLAKGDVLPTASRAWVELTRSSVDTVLAFGGRAVVGDAAVLAAQDAAGRQSPVWGLDR